jgi:hypothetical protein
MRFGSPRRGFPLATPFSAKPRVQQQLHPLTTEEKDIMSKRYSDDWDGFSKANADANRRNKVAVFDALSKAGITHVRVGFDGEGDQGQMENAMAQSNGTDVAFPAVTLSLWIAEYGCTELSTREMHLQEAVEHLCYGYLEDRHGGWEIDDGSFGEFTFAVAVRTVTLDFYGRLVDTDYTNHVY